MRRDKRLPLEEIQPVLLDVPNPPEMLSWNSIFGNDNPIEIEVGFGKGLFLVKASQARPDVNFVGVEIIRKYQLFTANRIAKRFISNVRLVCADARQWLRDCVPSDSVRTLHAFYPDPWWKKRHHKRRLFTPEFVQEAQRILRPDGMFHIITDVEDYFHIITELLQTHTSLQLLERPDEHIPKHDLDHLTNFERKAQQEGRGIHRLALKKNEPAESE